jgi:hypothetical protein
MTLSEAVACWWRVKIWEFEIDGSATGSIEAGGWDPETEAEYPRIEASADTAVNGDCTVPPDATVFDFRGVSVKGAKTGRAIQPDGAEYPVAEITCNLSGSGTVGQVYCDIDSPKDYYLAFSVGVTAGSWARDQWMDGVSKGSYVYFPAWTPSYTWDYEEGLATPSSKNLTVTIPSGRTLTVACQFYDDITLVSSVWDTRTTAASTSITSISLGPKEYWPYKNSDGDPIFDTTTGAQENPIT